MNIKPADVILVNSGTTYCKIILTTLRFFQKDDVEFGHVLLAVDDKRALAAESKVRYRDIEEYLKSVQSFKIIRNKNITDSQRVSIANKAKILLGLRYGFFRVVLQLLDQVFDTNFFTRWPKDKKMQICSTLVSWSYYVVARIEFNDVPWQSCEPDDIDDFSEKRPDLWEVIAEKSNHA